MAEQGPGPAPTIVSPGLADLAVPVLIVDDNAAKRLGLKAVLAPQGYRLVEADSGMAALRCLMQEDFAVILMDVRMPIMDGFETSRLIRQRDQSELTPIIFITAFGKDAMADMAAYATGAADFIFSPVPPAELQAKVSVFANIYRRAKFVAAQAHELQESSDALALLTDAAPIGIFRLSVEGTYLYVNTRWSEITGIASDEAMGQPWYIVTSEADAAEHGPTPFGYVQTENVLYRTRFETRHPVHSESRVMQGQVKHLLDRDNIIQGWVGTLSDVTDEEVAKHLLLDARDAALATTLMQHNFTASASHELRTPTTSIIGFIEEVLDNGEVSPADRKCLDIAHRSAMRLSSLIDDLLVLGQEDIGAGRMSLELTSVGALVETVVDSFSASAERAKVGLAVVTQSGSDADALSVLVDPFRLEQALNNLLSNALKFTPPGGTVQVLLQAAEDSVLIAVTDTGMGINPEALDSIFSRFYRAQEATDSGTKGTGLGLAIALQMIEAQGGQLTATSEAGKGSTFEITLPRANRQLAA